MGNLECGGRKWLAPLFFKKGTIDKSGETEIRQRSTLRSTSECVPGAGSGSAWQHHRCPCGCSAGTGIEW